jgi:UDP-glucose 4-epimerase
VLATARLLAGKTASNYEVYNLGTGKGYSVLEVIATFERVTGEQLAYTRAPRRQGDISAIYANASLAERELGWKAEKNLEDMIKSAWIWERYKQQTAHA